MDFISTVIGGTFGLIFSIIWVILVVYALMGIIKSSMNGTSKLMWLIIIFIVPVIGSLLYIFWGRNQSFI